MFNKQRTSISNSFLGLIAIFAIIIITVCLGCSYKLLKDLNTDTVNPIAVCEKINHLKIPEYIAHLILTIVLMFRGWWGIGILNVPFIFYHFAQWCEGRHLLSPNRVFSTLSQEMRVIKIKTGFFILVTLYNFWEYVTWTPPIYTPLGIGYNVMKNIQVSH
jgi:hypothetical protein